MNIAATVTLPAGLWIKGECHRRAELQPLTGIDESFHAEQEWTLMPAQRTTAQLTCSLARLGSIDKITQQVVRSLTIGDREALLLHLRRLTLGDRLQCLVECPSCQERMDIELKVSDLLLPPYSHSQESYERAIIGDEVACHVVFRLPTGADQEEAAFLAATDPDAGAALILHRCVKSVTKEDDKPIENLPTTVTTQLPTIMAELDPQAEITLNLSCPACGFKFSTVFDAATYLFQELVNRSRHLYQEVHLLAFNYHWSETEIMRMTSKKRHLYLGLLNEGLKGAACL